MLTSVLSGNKLNCFLWVTGTVWQACKTIKKSNIKTLRLMGYFTFRRVKINQNGGKTKLPVKGVLLKFNKIPGLFFNCLPVFGIGQTVLLDVFIDQGKKNLPG